MAPRLSMAAAPASNAVAIAPRPGAAAFLARHGWSAAEVRPLAGDASFRRYFRLHDRGRTAVLMDAPPPLEDVRPFLRIADLLLGAGFSAPRICAAEPDEGYLLLEDFGDALLGPLLLREPALEEPAYRRAIALLAALADVPVPADLPPYDRDALVREVMVFADWYAPAAGLAIDARAFVAAWDEVWGDLLRETAAGPVVTLRDYHAENLMWLPDRAGTAALGLLDFQDALAGHPAYDLVSLLQDARRDVSHRLESAMLEAYATARGIGDRARLRASYEVLGAQRNVKILGVFVRLRDRDGRRGYVERLPRVWAYLERNLAHPALAPVSAWFEAHVPRWLRAGWCR